MKNINHLNEFYLIFLRELAFFKHNVYFILNNNV